MGELECSGIGQPLDGLEVPAAECPKHACLAHNEALLSPLHEDPHADDLMVCVEEDVQAGRMTEPALAYNTDLSKVDRNCCFVGALACKGCIALVRV